MAQTEIEVRLPRFKMEESYNLKSVLISMGMEDAFTNSDFSGEKRTMNELHNYSNSITRLRRTIDRAPLKMWHWNENMQS